MWCTRWFLPLLLLPLPTAPPYFLLLFLFSLTMHARPCFYCIVLLVALFISSCYWQPLPITSPLSIPWSQNITTFSEALNISFSIPASDPTKFALDLPPTAYADKPPIIKLVDRCWCDFWAGSLFEPFNVTRWEHNSVVRLKQDLLDKKNKEQRLAAAASNTTDGSVAAPTPAPPRRVRAQGERALESLRSFWRAEPELDGKDEEVETEEVEEVEGKRASRPGEWNLEPYGFDLVLDFGWTRHPSS
jgi:hypothetical protein